MQDDVVELLTPAAWAKDPLQLLSGTELVARLVLEDSDYPWAICRFEPMPAWTELGPAVAAFSASSRSGLPGIGQIATAIVDLDLWLRSADSSLRVGNFLLLVRGDVARFRSFPRGEQPTTIRADLDLRLAQE